MDPNKKPAISGFFIWDSGFFLEISIGSRVPLPMKVLLEFDFLVLDVLSRYRIKLQNL